ncbi:hypothetical protein [Nocardia sp. NPDC051463]|uniref:hypothetical protein n=1 Tax=Nocardia sp. NPDC051463 TaxID=3154845 RepID=UPI003450FAD0
MSHSWVADASETGGVVGLGAAVPLGALVADPVVDAELPVGAESVLVPHAVSAAAAKTPATRSVLREIQRGCGIGTSARVDIVRIESAIVCAVGPVRIEGTAAARRI